MLVSDSVRYALPGYDRRSLIEQAQYQRLNSAQYPRLKIPSPSHSVSLSSLQRWQDSSDRLQEQRTALLLKGKCKSAFAR